jgi:mannose-6-phosphate isomerase-like protein (cupin superfamily)
VTAVGKVNLAEKLAQFDEHWAPRIVAEANGQEIRVAKVKGEFVPHHHTEGDEVFLVLKGKLRIEMGNRSVELREGELLVVPRGVEHRPVADEEAHLLVIDPASARNTGNVRDERTRDRLERI